MKPFPWFRVYSEARIDAKLAVLADDEHRVWFNLLCYASDQDSRGTVRAPDRFVLAVEVSRGDEDLLSRTLAKLVRLAVLSDDGEALTFLHFCDRQYDKPSDQPEQTRERKRRQRDRGVTVAPSDTTHAASRRVTPRHAQEEIETQTETRQDQNPPPIPPQPVAVAPVDVPATPDGAGAPTTRREPRRAKQASDDGYGLVTWWCETTRTDLRDDDRRRAALVADGLLGKCARAAASAGTTPLLEAEAFIGWRIAQGYKHSLTASEAEYSGAWRQSNGRARAPAGRNGQAYEGIVNEAENRSVYERRVMQ